VVIVLVMTIVRALRQHSGNRRFLLVAAVSFPRSPFQEKGILHKEYSTRQRPLADAKIG
jgi:hypothetical protein